jgi:hypothetical protein
MKEVKLKEYSMMKNLRNLMATALMVVGLLMTSCGENVDPNLADVKLKIKATSNIGGFDAGARTLEDHITFNQVLLGVTEIEFESIVDDHSDGDSDDHSGNDNSGHDDSDDDSSDDNSSDDNSDDSFDDSDFDIEYEGRFVVDLIAGTSNPDFGIADVYPGIYKEIELKLEPILENGHSIFIEFTYNVDVSEPVTVQYSTDEHIEFEIERSSGIQLEGGALNQILILFDLDRFLESININEANADVDGIVRINSNSNSDIATAIWSKLNQMMEAGEDQDGDDDFDSSDD